MGDEYCQQKKEKQSSKYTQPIQLLEYPISPAAPAAERARHKNWQNLGNQAWYHRFASVKMTRKILNKNIARVRNCPDVTILINLFGQDQSQGALGGHGGQGGQGGWGGPRDWDGRGG